MMIRKGKNISCKSVSLYAMFADCPIQPIVYPKQASNIWLFLFLSSTLVKKLLSRVRYQ